jgi:hypothetical protein
VLYVFDFMLFLNNYKNNDNADRFIEAGDFPEQREKQYWWRQL